MKPGIVHYSRAACSNTRAECGVFVEYPFLLYSAMYLVCVDDATLCAECLEIARGDLVVGYVQDGLGVWR